MLGLRRRYQAIVVLAQPTLGVTSSVSWAVAMGSQPGCYTNTLLFKIKMCYI